MLFADFAVRLDKLEQTPSRLKMTEILAGLFQDVSVSEIGPVSYILTGRVAPLYEPVEFGMADKFVVKAISQAYGVDPETVRKYFGKTGDLGIAAQQLYSRGLFFDEQIKPTILEVFSGLIQITKEKGEGSQDRKIELLSALFGKVTPLSARYIARIPLDKLRLGFSELTILDALSWMVTGDKSHRIQLEDAYNRRPDIAEIARQIKTKGLAGLKQIKVSPGVPVLAALCQRLPTADEMIEKMGIVAVEPKYDGVRVQIHYDKSKVKIEKSKIMNFSRNLENTTAMFPELDDAISQIKAESVILDSEAVGINPKTKQIIPFQETVTRKRKHGIEAAREAVPLRFYVFDILFHNGRDLLSEPLSRRREILKHCLGKGKVLKVSPQIVTDNAEKLRSYHDQQLRNGLEGAVVKKWDSPYEPGRRGFSWVKFKGEEGKTGKLKDTVDCVVMGYYAGEGKRSSFGIGAFLVGVKSGEGYVTVTKIGTGVTDDQWTNLKSVFEKLRSREKPRVYSAVNKTLTPDFWIDPEVVVEIAGDDLTRSPTHTAGYAIRFPRLVRVRNDKRPSEATTVKEIEEMYQSQGGIIK
jgi:DNA ligase-1